jgi:hypothetical protein
MLYTFSYSPQTEIAGIASALFCMRAFGRAAFNTVKVMETPLAIEQGRKETALGNAIICVVLIRPKKQMRRSHACPVIAMMEDSQPLRDPAIRKNPCYAVCSFDDLSRRQDQPKLPIPSSVKAFRPRPAAIVIKYRIDDGPKELIDRNSFKSWRHTHLRESVSVRTKYHGNLHGQAFGLQTLAMAT